MEFHTLFFAVAVAEGKRRGVMATSSAGSASASFSLSRSSSGSTEASSINHVNSTKTRSRSSVDGQVMALAAVPLKKTKSEVSALKAVFKNLKLTVVEEYFDVETKKELFDREDDLVDVPPFEVCQDVTQEAWHSYIDKIYGEDSIISLRSMECTDGKVLIVEWPIPKPHEFFVANFTQSFLNQVPMQPCGHPTVDHAEADTLFCPRPNPNRNPRPAGLAAGELWFTFAVEVAVSQNWTSLTAKATHWAQHAGVEYILCVKVSPQLNVLQFRLYSIPANTPLPVVLGNPASQGTCDLRSLVVNNLLVDFDCRRLLQIPVPHPLPNGVPMVAQVDLRNVLSDSQQALFALTLPEDDDEEKEEE